MVSVGRVRDAYKSSSQPYDTSIIHMQSSKIMPKRKFPKSTESKRKSNSCKQIKFSHHLPQFFDVESSITASCFATKRIPEIQTLWNKFQQSSNINHNDEAYFQSRGCRMQAVKEAPAKMNCESPQEETASLSSCWKWG